MCSIGTYQDESGQSSCKPCSIGFTTKYKGSQNITDCTGLYVIKDEFFFHHSKFMCFHEPSTTSKVIFDYRPTQLLRYDQKLLLNKHSTLSAIASSTTQEVTTQLADYNFLSKKDEGKQT